MIRLAFVAAAALAVAACSGDTAFPSPTGKGVVRALNAIEGSPDITFLNESRVQDRLGYKAASAGRRWDDFEYNFNFEVTFFGADEATRVASRLLKVEANRDYTFVLTGSFDAPTVLTWETDERVFDGSETVFEARFGHAAPSLGAVDVYFAAAGTVPVVGEALGTLAFGELLDPVDVEAGDYVVTLTTAGDPADIVYETDPFTYEAGSVLIIPVLDGDAIDTAPLNIQLLNAAGGAASLPDIRFPPTIRFIHAAIDLPPSDVYDDETLTSQVLTNHMFGDVTGDIPIAVGTTEYTYTAVGNSGAIQFESGISAAAGTPYNFIVIGEADNRVATTLVPDRRPVATFAKLRVYHAALNHGELDLYIVDPGTAIDDVDRTAQIIYSLQFGPIALDAGSYDIYLTVADEKTIVGGPFALDLALGDSLGAVIFDTVDPATAEFRVVPPP